MPPAIDVFGTAVLVLGLTALGLSVIFEASRLSAAAGKQALVRRRIQAREREKLDQKLRLESAESEAVQKQAALDALLAERTRIIAATGALKLSKIEMVHEIGEPESGLVLFQGDLRGSGAEAGRSENRRIVFAREIWERNNVAHVWADSPESAMAAVQRAFSSRSGIVATRVQRAALARLEAGRADPPHLDATPAAPAAEPAAGGQRAPARPPLRVASSQRAA